MVALLTALTSFGFIALALSFIALTLRDSGTAVLSALAGEPRFIPFQVTPQVRRVVRVRTVSVTPVLQMRAAA
jgi:hypothetical protein